MFQLDTAALNIVQRTALFQALSEGQRQALLLSMRQKKFAPGEVLIQQGQVGSTIYIMLEGAVNVVFGSGEKIVADIPMGSFFGELSAVLGEKTIASIVATEEVQVAFVDVNVLRNDPKIWSAFLLIVVKDLAFKLREANAKNRGS
jgi:CRP-like cAMP-binding protein